MRSTTRLFHYLVFGCPLILPFSVHLFAQELGSKTAENTHKDSNHSREAREQEEAGLDEEFEFLKEIETVETAARHKQEIGMSPSAITLITREDIETYGATSITELLRLVPGFHIVKVSPAYTGVTSRLTWNHGYFPFRVLVDGRDIYNEVLGAPVWEIEPISLSDIERIEVIRGPASALYGSNALSGLINITTRAVPEKGFFWARVVGGESGTIEAGARAAKQLGDFGLSFTGAAERQGLFVNPDQIAKQTWKIRSLADYRLSESQKLSLDLGFSQGSGMVPTSTGTVDEDINNTILRLAYDSERLRGHLYWTLTNSGAALDTPLEYNGIRLATIPSMFSKIHTIDSEFQWTLPRFYDPLLTIIGAGSRLVWLGSDDLLDPRNYADINSPRYHKTGLDYWEVLNGIFVHSEYSPADWIVLTGGLRFDYNLETTGELSYGGSAKKRSFLSPRLAAVFRPAEGHFVRLGVAQAFRRPAFLETSTHPAVKFPKDSPLKGSQEEQFQEFMARNLCNKDLDNGKLLSFEIGYLGQFFDKRLSVALDLYFNRFQTYWGVQKIVLNAQGLPDLNKSFFGPVNGEIEEMMGGELSVHVNVYKSVSLLASWSQQEVFDAPDRTPKNLFTVGGRFQTSWGLIGSLYVFSRSEFIDGTVENPKGLMEPWLREHLDQVFLAVGKCGWQWGTQDGIQMETGINLFLPISPFGPHTFRTYEKAGGVTSFGKMYGGVELGRMVTAYLQGSY